MSSVSNVGVEYTNSELTSNYVSLYKLVLAVYNCIDATVTSSMFNSPMPSVYPHLPQAESIQYDALGGDFDSFPENIEGQRENHGTNCAGEIIMEKGNEICGVGVAYNSFLTGNLQQA